MTDIMDDIESIVRGPWLRPSADVVVLKPRAPGHWDVLRSIIDRCANCQSDDALGDEPLVIQGTLVTDRRAVGMARVSGKTFRITVEPMGE